jgi:hypothetical protein
VIFRQADRYCLRRRSMLDKTEAIYAAALPEVVTSGNNLANFDSAYS